MFEKYPKIAEAVLKAGRLWQRELRQLRFVPPESFSTAGRSQKLYNKGCGFSGHVVTVSDAEMQHDAALLLEIAASRS
jgi:hypothetical protein